MICYFVEFVVLRGLNGLRSKWELYELCVSFLVWSICCSIMMAFQEMLLLCSCAFKKWGKILCKNALSLRNSCIEMWWLFACCFRIQRLFWRNSLSPMLCIQLHSWPVPLAASHLWLFSLGHCFKKSLKTLLTPFLLSSWCQVWQSILFQKKRWIILWTSWLYYLCRYSQEKKSIGSFKP